MGRELKRIALGFDWPLDKTWKGYLNPHYIHARNCPFCDGSHQNPETKQIEDDWYDFAQTGNRWCDKITQDEVDALVEGGRLCEWRGRDNGGWVSVPRTAADVNAANAGGGGGIFGGLGHDAVNRWICVETRAKRLGVYGPCQHCEDGTVWRTPADKATHDAWEMFEPPAGDGYQLWETTSEGSPISPVMQTPEQLARWLADNGASTFGSSTTNYDTWLAFIRGPGWAPSMVAGPGGVQSGVDAAVDLPDSTGGSTP